MNCSASIDIKFTHYTNKVIKNTVLKPNCCPLNKGGHGRDKLDDD